VSSINYIRRSHSLATLSKTDETVCIFKLKYHDPASFDWNIEDGTCN